MKRITCKLIRKHTSPSYFINPTPVNYSSLSHINFRVMETRSMFSNRTMFQNNMAASRLFHSNTTLFKKKNNNTGQSSGSSGYEFEADKMEKDLLRFLHGFEREIKTISIRPKAELLELIDLDEIPGKKVKNLANVVVKNPRLMLVTVFDEAHVDVVDSSIRAADLGFNPQRKSGSTILEVIVPKVTKEVRDNFIHKVKQHCEDTKNHFKKVRNNFNKKIQKEKKSGGQQDQAFRDEKEMNQVFNDFTKKLDQLRDGKIRELSQ